MTDTDKSATLAIGKLVVEQFDLEKQIGSLRDELGRRAAVFAQVGKMLLLKPERLVFEGENVTEQFAGESPIERNAMDVAYLIADLRAAIVGKGECTAQLAELGIDPEEIERRENARNSRAVWNPANASPDPAPKKAAAVGFTVRPKKSGV